MEVIPCQTKQEASRMAARFMLNQVANNKYSVLGLATGGTPLLLYEEFIKMVSSKDVDLESITTFNLDEYVGLAPNHKASYSFYMNKHFFEPLGLNEDQCFVPNGVAHDIPKECERYEDLILEKGPIDLQVLGIGRDGHIGFNEPGSSLVSSTRIKTLTEETQKDNAQFFDSNESVPKHVITMGIRTILSAKRIVLLAFGEAKADAVAKMVEGPVSASLPASVLQMHSSVKVIVDEGAASKLNKLDYYKEVFANKPTWQRKEFL